MPSNEPASWRTRSPAAFTCEKHPATARGGMVVTNHPLATSAGLEMLAAGGNAVDAAIAALFALTIVEPMMVGLIGGGMAHIRRADGHHVVVDGMSTAPAAARPDTFRPLSLTTPDNYDAEGRENFIGAKSVAVPGALKAWCLTLERYGTLPLADVMEPAIRHAARGFKVTPFLADCIGDTAADLALDAEIARLLLPGGQPLQAGDLLVQGDAAETLRAIAREGAGHLHGGALGRTLAEHFRRAGGLITLADLAGFEVIERVPVRGTYRGVEIAGPPPPSSGGVHVIQMLNILEGYDIKGLGFGSAEALHLIAEVLKIAFADRARSTGDPAFVDVPVERLLSKAYADERRAALDPTRAQTWTAAASGPESANTTHVTTADKDGAIVATTQTINSLFGARFIVPGTGLIPNNYMHLFDPRPSGTLSIAPGKRITTSQAPLIGLKDGKPAFALGLTGGLRIFGSAMQAVLNLVDHRMSPQEAVEAPRLWTQGGAVEAEARLPAAVRESLAAKGQNVVALPHVGGGMNAIAFSPDGTMTGAACWRADGHAAGLGGGLARAGVRFWPDRRRG
jgi:gamma-glutamyltranspeptidase / glutathione hydrolase